MPLTPNSAATSFCTPAQFLVFYDYRTVGELLNDADMPLTAQGVLASTTLAFLLQAAAGKIEMATSMGDRYQPSDLTALAATGTNMALKLARLNADIAMEELWRRRPDMPPQLPQFEEATAMLEALAGGHLVFGFTESMDAGIIDTYAETSTDVDNRRMPSQIAKRMMGTRSNQRSVPPSHGW